MHILVKITQFPFISPPQALKLVQPCPGLQWHPVSKSVGSIKSQGPELIQPVQTEAAKKQRLAQGLQSWLKTGSVTASPTKSTVSSSKTHANNPGAPASKRNKAEDQAPATIVVDDDDDE